MKIKLIVVSKTDVPYIQAGIDEYAGRLRHYCDFELAVIPALKNAGTLRPEELKEREGQLILKQLDKIDMTVLLDEHGKEYTSVGFAEYLQKQMNSGTRTLAFVIGGAYGFSPAVYAAAQHKISLSQMTFNHQMVRLFFVEQLYRAHTILRHEKYHND
ncbi:MAG: 23S rRNA (pseudouridine(1915)-N(3))-methyltransferase RlmH [Bacteroidales bacterium]|nr:23S rRNA (pseudouridine(1915)-N(3))-methyltransferase RlmH [Bacteroidales bacterium]MDY6370776.1 23S rRNA (pseudouridine(1915)-N(3))-methyltransferase RlmH [Bacteroidales bacterium]